MLSTQLIDKKIKDFLSHYDLPFGNRKFFIKHLFPYIFSLDFARDKMVLEIGVGSGYGMWFVSLVARTTLGIDYDFSQCIEASKKGIVTVNSEGTRLGIRDNTFDLILSFQVIEHIPEERLDLFLEEIKRALKKDGLAVISTLNRIQNIKNPEKYEKYKEHHKEFDYDELYSLLKRHFPILDIYGLHITFKHAFFQRLKKWGFLKHPAHFNPVKRFYQNISCTDFKISKTNFKKCIDFLCILKKG